MAGLPGNLTKKLNMAINELKIVAKSFLEKRLLQRQIQFWQVMLENAL